MNKHAKLIKQYAEDCLNHDQPWLLWEHDDDIKDIKFSPCLVPPAWDSSSVYRRKPDKKDTVLAYGVILPKPVKVPLNGGDKYYSLSLDSDSCNERVWYDSNPMCHSDPTYYDFFLLEKNRVFLTKEDAQAWLIFFKECLATK